MGDHINEQPMITDSEQSAPETQIAVLDRLKLLQDELLAERRHARRWRAIRLSIFLLLPLMSLLVLVLSAVGGGTGSGESTVALVRMDGTIGPGEEVNAVQMIPALVTAFKDPGVEAVVLAINSPGGTPVQASLIHDRLVKLKAEFDKPLVVVASDTLASGAYFIAAAADRIVVNRSTVTGSIGVISQQFGIVELMNKVGVESRVLTAGESKARMSPFTPASPGDKAKLESVLAKIHEHFKDAVREGREGRLRAPEELLFSGDFWTGEEAVALGLADEIGDLHDVLKSLKSESYRDFSPRDNPLSGLTKGFLSSVGQWLDLRTTAVVELR